MEMMKQKFLYDCFPLKLQLLESKDNGRIVGRGIFGVVDTPTENGRIYPRKVMEREIERVMPEVKNRMFFGELDHPQDGKTALSRVSHIVTDLRLEGNEIVGELEVLNTERGLNLQAILEAGGKVGVSVRGLGSVIKEGQHELVQDDYQLLGFDIVYMPSVLDSYPEFIKENKEVTKNDKKEVSMSDKEVKEKEKKEIEIKSEETDDEKEVKGCEKKEKKKLSLEELETEFPEVVEELKKKIEKKIKEEVEAELEKFKEKIKEQLESGKVSSDELSNALKKVTEIIDSEKAEKEAELEKKVEDLEDKVNKVKEENLRLRTENISLQKLAKWSGYTLLVEKLLENHPDKKVIKEEVGDVLNYPDMMSLRKKVEEIKEKKEKERREEEKIQARVKVLKEENEALKSENEVLKGKISQLKQSLEESLRVAGKMGLIAYAENVSRVLEKPQILVEEVKRGELSDVESINRRVEELKKEEIKRREREEKHFELDEELDRIRRMARLRERPRAFGRGLEYLYEEKNPEEEKSEKINVPLSVDLKKELEGITGADFDTIKKLSEQ
jgi:hypothetical protein